MECFLFLPFKNITYDKSETIAVCL